MHTITNTRIQHLADTSVFSFRLNHTTRPPIDIQINFGPNRTGQVLVYKFKLRDAMCGEVIETPITINQEPWIQQLPE